MTKQHTYLGGAGGNLRASMVRALLAGLAALLVLTMALAPPAQAQLSGVERAEGPGLPDWYQDSTGLRLSGVQGEPDPPAAPNATPAPPAETIYWAGEASLAAGGTVSGLLNMDLIGYDANGPAEGGETTAATIKVNLRGLTPGQAYTITHPYGVATFTADAQGRIVEVLDVKGCDEHVTEVGGPCDFTEALGTSIGPFLVWNPAAGPAPDGSIGDPEVAHEVIGSPNNTNFFRVDGPNVGGQGVDRAQTDLFNITGEVDGLAAFASLKGGTFEQSQSVTLASSDSAANVFYTTDGTDPTTSSTRYAGPVNIGQTSTLKFAAIGPEGQSPVFTERYVITPPTALSLSGPASVNDGQSATLSGQLTSNGTALAGKPVILEEKAAGASSFTQVGTAQSTDASGNFSFSVQPNGHTAYRVSFAGEPEGFKASQSNEQQVNVASTTSLTLSKAKVDRSLKQSEVISGTVSGAQPGERVNLTIKKGTAEVRNVSLVLNGSSSYSHTFKTNNRTKLGPYAVTVSYAGDDNTAGSTKSDTFRVVK